MTDRPMVPVRTPRAIALAERMARAMQERVLSFPLTAFTADGIHIAESAFREHVRTRVENGAGAVFIACGTGEFSALNEAQYRDVISIAVDEVDNKVPVIAGIGYGWAQALSFASIAEESGADGALLLPQYLVRGPQHGLVTHVKQVAAETDLPLIVYQRGVASYDPSTVAEVSTLPTVIGLKDGRSDYPSLQMATIAVDSDFLFFNGALTAEMQYRPYASLGITSYSSAVHAFAPEIANAFFAATRSGDDETMDELLLEFYAPLIELRDQVDGYAVALVKAGARTRGQEVGPVRAPLGDPSDEDIDKLNSIVRRGLAIVGANF